MVDTVSVVGGAKAGTTSLTAAEHHAATQALARLESLDRSGVASVLGGSAGSATLSGGAPHALSTTVVGSGKVGLVTGIGSDTFLGGVSAGAGHLAGMTGHEAVVAGSAGVFGHAAVDTAMTAEKGLSLSNDTINVSGVTAASVKADQSQHAQAGGTLTFADKTTINLIGVSTHDTPKAS